MHETEREIEKVILCGVHTGALNTLDDTTEESMAELFELARTAQAEIVGEMVQNKDHPEASTYFDGRASCCRAKSWSYAFNF